MADRRLLRRAAPRLTRRRLLLGGAATLAAAAGAQYGRFGAGAEFEQHVARTLGISTAAAAWLLEGARTRLGDGSYQLRAAAFLSVTTLPGRLLPEGVRERGVGPLVFPMIEEHADTAVLLGLREPGPRTCAGLGPP